MAGPPILRDFCRWPKRWHQISGIESPDQSTLVGFCDGVVARIKGRGTHQAPFAEAGAHDIANAYTSAVFRESNENQTYFDLTAAQFTKILFSSYLAWAPDGDEALDDSS